MKRAEILDAAKQIVCEGREEEYGAPEDNFRLIAELWMPYLNQKCVGYGTNIYIATEDVAVMMALLKMARIASGQAKTDNWIDACGYMACGGEIEGGE